MASRQNDKKQTNHLKGALYGALVGDALGVPVEFEVRAALKLNPVKKMEEYGAWRQPKGTWSDDGALTLASADVLAKFGLENESLADAFVGWWRDGVYCAGDRYFDIGGTTRAALSRWERMTHETLLVNAADMGGKGERDNGNGSLMRIAPVALWTVYDDYRHQSLPFPQAVEDASAITHGHMQSRLACSFYAFLMREITRANYEMDKLAVFHDARNKFLTEYGISDKPEKYEAFWRITNPTFGELPEDMIQSGGYVIHTLEASVWCWLNTNSYEEAVLRAVNLGGDTDTTGCVTGALAGYYYGYDAIPKSWVAELRNQALVRDIAKRFVNATLNHWDIVR